MPTKEPALRKRQQIAQANKTMFVWVAIASALVGVAAVAAIFLTQRLLFNEKVLAEKELTITTLRSNNKIADELKKKIRVLDTNQALIDSRAKPEDTPLQSVLDALPAKANSLALGSSIQSKIFAGVPGLTVETIQVDPVVGEEYENVSESAVSTFTEDETVQNAVYFRFSILGDANALKEVLVRMEKSIRLFDVDKVAVESQTSNLMMTVEGKAFYEPAKTIELKDKTVKP